MSDVPEIWRVIPEFPNYAVSNYGGVSNIKKNTILEASANQLGVLTVGLSRDGVQYRRSIKVLVAERFVPGRSEIHDTVIQLDQNESNFFAGNLAWRPRWFAWQYRNQFRHLPGWVYSGPVVDTTTGRQYETILHATIAEGALYTDIRKSLSELKPVFPNNGVFMYG